MAKKRPTEGVEHPLYDKKVSVVLRESKDLCPLVLLNQPLMKIITIKC